MDLHAGEQVVFKGHPSWRASLSFYLGGVAAADPGVVLDAVDRAQREASAARRG
jgi:hypothetical protein